MRNVIRARLARRSALVVLTLTLLLAGFNFSVWKMERLREDGESVFLELAPRDPRALMLGDYMRLNYRLAASVEAAYEAALRKSENIPETLVISLNARQIASFVRLDNGQTLAENERRLKPRRLNSGAMQVAPGAFFFQEGHAQIYEEARYGELKLSPQGDCLLVGLRDENLKLLESPASSSKADSADTPLSTPEEIQKES
ncbi:MAG: GDYXXLXY domain-containing protein [Zoogloeaceae bacterium]|jgi:uncharacterized membrane-anchored protein|nr:GDYXXLXY domain-containing protein [Zoogloeaceae bacterium]